MSKIEVLDSNAYNVCNNCAKFNAPDNPKRVFGHCRLDNHKTKRFYSSCLFFEKKGENSGKENQY